MLRDSTKGHDWCKSKSSFAQNFKQMMINKFELLSDEKATDVLVGLKNRKTAAYKKWRFFIGSRSISNTNFEPLFAGYGEHGRNKIIESYIPVRFLRGQMTRVVRNHWLHFRNHPIGFPNIATRSTINSICKLARGQKSRSRDISKVSAWQRKKLENNSHRKNKQNGMGEYPDVDARRRVGDKSLI